MWKSLDHGAHWAGSVPISPARAGLPANAGKYASGVKPGPLGTITAFSPSSRSAHVLWAGTTTATSRYRRWRHDLEQRHAVGHQAVDAHLQYRRWSLRCGDGLRGRQHAARGRQQRALLAHARWREDMDRDQQRDRGRGPVANSIREDPRTKGLLYAATNTQVWVLIQTTAITGGRSGSTCRPFLGA